MTNSWEKAEQRIVKYPIYISWAALVFVTFMVVIDVSGRFFFNRPLPASPEISELLLPYIVFPCVAYALSIGSHIRVTMLTSLLPQRVQLSCEIIASIVGAVIFGIMAYQGWSIFWKSFLIKEEMQAAIALPWWLSKFIFPVGAAMFCLQFLVQLVIAASKLKKINRAQGGS